MTHELLDKNTQKIIYRSAVRPITTANPNHRLEIGGGESGISKKPIPKVPTVLSDPDRMMLIHLSSSICLNLTLIILICRTFLLPPQENVERIRAKVTKKVVEETEDQDGNRIPNINFILDIGDCKVEEIITYNQLLDHLEQPEEQDNSMDQDLWSNNMS